MSDFVDDRWVPKTHPLARDIEPEDPFELMAAPAYGDPEVMLECMLQEFLWMGWNREQLLSLFHNPGYPVLVELREFYGDEEIQRRVATLIASSGVWRFRESIVEDDEQQVEVHGIAPLPSVDLRRKSDVPGDTEPFSLE